MILRKLKSLLAKPQPIKRRIGDYVYWTDQYGRVIREYPTPQE